ncbi:keratin type I cytoskeletal 18-like isoform X1 [Gracilaria domingensis]|nr:keratin type I cytoskeletal 18-like isoform X1 [Gracilaria domingensis]
MSASLVCGAVGATVPFVILMRRETQKCVDHTIQEMQAVCERSLQETEQCRTDLNKALQLASMLETTVEGQRLTQKGEKEEVIDGLMTEQMELKNCLTAVSQRLKLSLAKEKEQKRVVKEHMLKEHENEEIIEGLRKEQRELKNSLLVAEQKLMLSLDKEKKHEGRICELEHENEKLQNVVEKVERKAEKETVLAKSETETVITVRPDQNDMGEGSTGLEMSEVGQGTEERACSGSANDIGQESSVVDDSHRSKKRRRKTKKAKKSGAKDQVELNHKKKEQTSKAGSSTCSEGSGAHTSNCSVGKTSQTRKSARYGEEEKRMWLKGRLDSEVCAYLRIEALEGWS